MSLLNIAIQKKIDEEQLAREQAARGQVRGLIGQAPRQEGAMIETPIPGGDPGDVSVQFPTTIAGTGAMETGQLDPVKLYQGLLTTPGYEQIGAQGLQGLLATRQKQQAAATKQKQEEIEKQFGQEQKIRGEFRGETKEFIDVNNAYGRIQASAQDPSPAGDLSLIFNYMKMLDPQSVVRESEFATAAKAGEVPDRIWGLYNKVLTGQKLTPQQRADFVGRSGTLYNKALDAFQKRKTEFGKLAESYELDPAKATFTRQIHERYTPSIRDASEAELREIIGQ